MPLDHYEDRAETAELLWARYWNGEEPIANRVGKNEQKKKRETKKKRGQAEQDCWVKRET